MNTILEWEKLESKVKDERSPNTCYRKMFISNDHMIFLMTNEAYTFHLKEFYWSKHSIEKQSDAGAMSSKSCLARPGLIVDLDSALVLKLLTFDIEEGNLCLFSFSERSFSAKKLLSKVSSAQQCHQF